MPAWLADGMSIGGGMVAAVGYAMVINMMATKKLGHSLLRFRCCMYQRNHIDRSWCNRCCYRTCLLRT